MLAFSKFAKFRDAKLWLAEDLTKWEQAQRSSIVNVMEQYWGVDHIPMKHFTRA